MTVQAENDDAAQQGQADDQAEQQDQQQSGEMPGGAQSGAADDQPDDEVVVTIGNAEPPPAEEDEFKGPAPAWVKELRVKHREAERELRELRAKVADKEAPNAAKVEKPTLAGCDYDEEVFEQRLDAWKEQEKARKAAQDAEAEQQRKAHEHYQTRLTAYASEKSTLKVADFDDAEGSARDILSPTQQGMIVHAADKPALLMYALGKNPAKAKELADINDPVKFAFAVAKLEDKLTVTSRKAPPPPEKTVRGSAPTSGSVDTKLAALEAEADRTGDRSKVIAYRRQLRDQQAA